MINQQITKINQLIKDAEKEQSSSNRQQMIIDILKLMMKIQ
jgi:hypothetical protein